MLSFLRACVFQAQMQLLVQTGRVNSKHLNTKMPSYLCGCLPSFGCAFLSGKDLFIGSVTAGHSGILRMGTDSVLKRHVCTWLLCTISHCHHWEMHLLIGAGSNESFPSEATGRGGNENQGH